MTVFEHALMWIGGWVVGRRIYDIIKLMFFDREGNSGRYRRWDDDLHM